MFNFSKNKNACPIDEENRIWIENSFIWLIHQFGENIVTKKKILLPIKEDFPIVFNGTEESAFSALKIVCRQMETNVDLIQLEFYKEKNTEINNEIGNSLFTQQYEDENYSVGLYLGKTEQDKFIIGIEKSLLTDTDKLIATIAHELAHVKIAGENRLQDAAEHLIDLVTVFFGLGLFNANAAVKFYKSLDRCGYSKQGYFTQQEWGYALALYAYIKHEKQPQWMQYLTPNVKSDFIKSELFIYGNTDKVLV